MFMCSFLLCKWDMQCFVVAFGNYRLTDGVMYERRGILYNETVIKEFNTKLGVKHKFITNDSLVPFVDPHPIDSVVNRNVRICSNNTFLLMIYLIRSKAYRMRQILRRIIPQGVIVKERRINRIFVIGVDDMDKRTIQSIQAENKQYGDIIVSRHKESYAATPILLWDGLMWAKGHCSHTVFVGKFDPDAVVFLGNLIEALTTAPTYHFYGGRVLSFMMQPRTTLKARCLPYDYPERRSIKFLSGPAMLLSSDLIDYLLIGAEYEPFFSAADDVMVGSVLNRVGILPQEIGSDDCPFMIWTIDKHRYYSDYRLIPECVSVYHDVKSIDKYCEVIEYYNISSCNGIK